MSDIDRLMPISEVKALTSLSDSTIRRLMARHAFPHPLKLSPGTVRWEASKVKAWLDALPVAAYRVDQPSPP